MPTVQWRFFSPYDETGRRIETWNRSKTWSHSPIDAQGNLILRSNPYSLLDKRTTSWEYPPPGRGGVFPFGNAGQYINPPPNSASNVYNKAYARFRGKIYSGSASLAVTAATAKESRDMIVERSGALKARFDNYIRRANSSRNLEKFRESMGGAYVESQFGWAPLIQDLWAAAYTVIQQAQPPHAVTGRGSLRRSGIAIGPENVDDWNAEHKCSVSAIVAVTNPNLWLVERAGLINPLTAVWDLVPWSWVFNMVVNVSQLINSISDFAGLSFSNQSVTWTHKAYSTSRKRNSSGYSTGYMVQKNRTVGGIPSPNLSVRLPGVDWGLAAIATALLAERSQTLRRLMMH